MEPTRSVLPDFFTVVSGTPWGVPSAVARYVFPEGFTPPSAYCCDTDIEMVSGGTICDQSSRFKVIARASETCLLDQLEACTEEGMQPLLTQEGLDDMSLGEVLLRYIGWIAVNGMPDEGVMGLTTNPFIPTYTIQLTGEEAQKPREFVEKFSAAWSLTRGALSGLTAAPMASGEWFLMLGVRGESFMSRLVDNSAFSIGGMIAGTCPNVCTLPPGLSPGKVSDFLLESSLDQHEGIEMYLIKKRALRIYANRFDANGNITNDPGGSFVYFCPPSNQNCLKPVKIGFIRTAGLLIPKEGCVVRIKLIP
jgi:hypothetical protein